MLGWIKCLLGFHDWHIANEVQIQGTGFTDDPADYECGGIDYILTCARCPMAKIESRRGVWLPLPYPNR